MNTKAAKYNERCSKSQDGVKYKNNINLKKDNYIYIFLFVCLI